MPIYLPKEMETEICGTGYGFICIKQKDIDGHEHRVSLSIHQFSAMVNHEKTLIREAVTPDDTP